MPSNIEIIDKFHATKKGKIIFGAGELIIAWVIGIIAVDSGAIWQHVLVVILFIGGIRNLTNAFHTSPNHAKKRR